MTKARPGRPRILCYDKRYFCRMTLWLELMVGIIMTILGLFILLLSMESLKAGDFAAVYFCSSFIVLGVVLLLVYYVHYYALKISVKRQVQKLDASIKSDQDALAALARRGLQFSKFAAVRQAQAPVAVAAADAPADAIVANVDETVDNAGATTAAVVSVSADAASSAIVGSPSAYAAATSAVRWCRQDRQTDSMDADEGGNDRMSSVDLTDLEGIWETRQTTV